jgi:crotonobetainyl-CoA:carnitine CoA-transferase CaiB-like acyl-CoA transferase
MSEMKQTESALPLAGIKVIELGTLIAAPFAARILGEFGAEVIKVEPPLGGDPLRNWREMRGDTSLWWYVQSRNKKSITLNLKNPDGQEILKRLVADADIVIENFRPGTLESWNIGWEQLSKINPKLVMVRISGFGQTGPYRDRPGFGSIGEALGGIRFTTGAEDRPPSRTGISLGDSLASLHAIVGAMICLLLVKTGKAEGQVVDVSLVESVFNLMESMVPEYDLLGIVRGRTGSKLPGIAPSNSYLCADGSWIVIAGNSDSIFRRLMNAIGRTDLAEDTRFRSNAGRVAAENYIDEAISNWAGLLSISDVMAALDRAEVPNSPIYSVAEIVKDEHFAAREMIISADLPDGTRVKMPGIVPKLSRTPGGVKWIGPELGSHTEEVLKDIGLARDQIETLRATGVIG